MAKKLPWPDPYTNFFLNSSRLRKPVPEDQDIPPGGIMSGIARSVKTPYSTKSTTQLNTNSDFSNPFGRSINRLSGNTSQATNPFQGFNYDIPQQQQQQQNTKAIIPTATTPKPQDDGSGHQSKYQYSSEQDFGLRAEVWNKDDPHYGQYRAYDFNPDTKKYEYNTNAYYPAGYRPAVKGGKIKLYDKNTGQYYDVDKDYKPILTSTATPGATTPAGQGTGAVNNTGGQGAAVPMTDQEGTISGVFNPPDGEVNNDDEEDVTLGGLGDLAPDSFDENMRMIKKLRQADVQTLLDQKKLNTQQMITGTAVSLPMLMSSLFGEAPDMIQAPQVAIPDLEYNDSIYRQQQRENLGAMAGLRNYLKQHGMQEMAPGILADYFNAANQANAQESTNRTEFLNQNAVQVADAQTKQNAMNYEAQKAYADSIDAINKDRADKASLIMSQMLNNYYQGARQNIAVDAEGNKVEGIYELLKQYAKQGDYDKMYQLMAYYNIGPEVYSHIPAENVNEVTKNTGN